MYFDHYHYLKREIILIKATTTYVILQFSIYCMEDIYTNSSWANIIFYHIKTITFITKQYDPIAK